MQKLADGQSLAEVARAQDKSVDGLKQAMLADAKERLDQAVEEGMLSRAQADEKLSAIEAKLDAIVNGNFRAPGERESFRWRSGPPDHGGWSLPPAA
jgi:hypothetical protein